MPSLITHGASETEALGNVWGQAAQRGWVMGLVGDLGAGKTQLVKGLARGLGITARVHSPTFTLLNIYAGGRLTLNHIDLYRLETQEQIIAAGLEEYLTTDGVTVIEWAERWFGTPAQLEGQFNAPRSTLHAPRPPLRWVQIETITQNERRITYDDIGA